MPQCRICLDDDDERNLISPCLCRGSVEFIHRECLLSEVQFSGNEKCTICNQRYFLNEFIRLHYFIRLLLALLFICCYTLTSHFLGSIAVTSMYAGIYIAALYSKNKNVLLNLTNYIVIGIAAVLLEELLFLEHRKQILLFLNIPLLTFLWMYSIYRIVPELYLFYISCTGIFALYCTLILVALHAEDIGLETVYVVGIFSLSLSLLKVTE